MFRSSVNKWWWKNWCYIHHTPIARKLPGKKKYSGMEITLLTVMYGDVKSKFRVILNTAMCFQLMVIFARVWSVCFFSWFWKYCLVILSSPCFNLDSLVFLHFSGSSVFMIFSLVAPTSFCMQIDSLTIAAESLEEVKNRKSIWKMKYAEKGLKVYV